MAHTLGATRQTLWDGERLHQDCRVRRQLSILGSGTRHPAPLKRTATSMLDFIATGFTLAPCERHFSFLSCLCPLLFRPPTKPPLSKPITTKPKSAHLNCLIFLNPSMDAPLAPLKIGFAFVARKFSNYSKRKCTAAAPAVPMDGNSKLNRPKRMRSMAWPRDVKFWCACPRNHNG